MSFSYELISDTDKERLNISNIKIGFHNANPTWWAFDKEIDACLVWIVQDREPPHAHWYVFRWKNKTVELSVLVKDGPSIPPNTPTLVATARWMASSPFATELQDESSPMTLKIKEAVRVYLQGDSDRGPWGTLVTNVTLQKY